jgi:pimeloyl-ACP methyl ester carboxylesterase
MRRRRGSERRVILLDDCGHWIPQEKPEQTSTALLDLLRGLD